MTRMPEDYWGYLTTIGSTFCNTEKQDEVQAFFAERIKTMTGGPRNLAKTLEGIDLCVAKVHQHQAEMNDWLGQ